MRSIFFKIFAWFWLANILVVGVLLLTMERHPDRKPDQFAAWSGDMLVNYGQQALRLMHTQGPRESKDYLDQLLQRTGVRIFIIDEKARNLLGDPLPPMAHNVLDRARLEHGDVVEADHESGLFIARAVPEGPQGTQIVFLGRLPGPPQPFVSSYRTILRVLAAVAMAGILCYGLAHYLTTPLRNLRHSARQLASGDLHTRVGSTVDKRRDEIGDLGNDFNFMAERIESLISSQQRLILDMSHELRSPLARLNLALGLATQRSGPEAKSALDRISLEAERLNDLIERMLILARLENKEAAGERLQIDLADMVRDIVADAEFEAQAHGRGTSLLRCDPCTITGIPHLLRSAIDNVVRNSLRYTAENTQVEISLTVEETPTSSAIIRVRDYGPGVPEGTIEQIFRPFCRVGDDRNRQTGGVGLGLAIARKAVQLHGGTITASNIPAGGFEVEMKLSL